ncbi:hypothetical protein A8990_10494 [Paenibacillus taihuensis]|uniref:Uncharacterized protein n=1 Tax=Paenibacillus taihuensis TaxID=1156355 RepID=A0A3D9SPH3_9BACL|nr:hypothetical protein [Paenibacillus taihuensis]REE91586.1 hypothetical protein A8990_10494 [Paenibacillus taihuensis]
MEEEKNAFVKPVYNVYSMVEHLAMIEMRKKHPHWIWNRSDTHVILGVPTSHEGYKTVAEPGNSFSPGHRTFGVSPWIYAEGRLHTPEELPLNRLSWRFRDGYIPVLTSTWNAGKFNVVTHLFTDGDPDTNDIRTYFTVELENSSSDAATGLFYLPIRSFGASGGPIVSLAMEGSDLVVNDGRVMHAEEQPTRFGSLSYSETGLDISDFLKRGTLPPDTRMEDRSSWASGALEYSLSLAPGEKRKLSFAFQLHADNWMVKKMLGLEERNGRNGRNETGAMPSLEEFAVRWEDQNRIKLDLPDRRFQEAMLAQLTHLYMFTVEAEPRITPISYPLWWLRDGAYILAALGKGGFQPFNDRATRAVAHRDAFGGFGAEGDGPANGIWMISEHYLLTRDKEYLKDMYPHIVRKAELIRSMRHTDVPIKRHNDNRTPEMLLRAESDMMCIASVDGLIVGRMDHSHPGFWINGHSYMALKRAAMCAKELGIEGAWFDDEAEDLHQAILRKAENDFGENPRDYNSVFWPTGWGDTSDPHLIAGMDKFWNEERFPGGKHAPEPLWTYFEAGQAHNLLLMGRADRAWVSIEHFLNNHTAPGLYTYHEGCDDENSSLQWQRARGWDLIRYVTPHGWTAAEVFLLLRDCLAREKGDSLIIGSGIPESWLTESFSVRGMPTYFGQLSFEYSADDRSLSATVERAPGGGVRSALPPGVSFNWREEAVFS